MNYCYSYENGQIKNKYIVYSQQCITVIQIRTERNDYSGEGSKRLMIQICCRGTLF